MNTPNKDWSAWIAIAALFAFLYFFGRQTGGFVLNILTRGKRLTWTTPNAQGDIDETPDDLADSAANQVNRPVDANEYALARMLASEEESSSQQTKVAIAWVAVNVSRARGQSVVELLTTDRNEHGWGKFGQQAGRWASTRDDPYEGDLLIAQAVFNGQVGDPTNGAVHFFNPSLQDRLLALGKVKASAADIDTQWGGNGFKVDGVNPDVTFYRNA